MKKFKILSAAFLMLFIASLQPAQARIWRVNILSNYNGTTLWGDNLGGTPANPVFSQLLQPNGYGGVQNNDTIHLEGAVAEYTGITLTKKLIIIGPGYFLTDNPNTSNNLLESKLSYITFATGSGGSQLIGVHITGSISVGINSGVSNITVKRCRIDYDLNVPATSSDIYVLQNYFANTTNSNASCITVSNLGFPSNFIFNNNITKRTLLLFSGATIYFADECRNNVFDCPALSGSLPSIKLLCSNFQNNILKTTGATVDVNNGITSSSVSYNISAAAVGQFGTDNNNIVVADQTTLFVSSPSNDGKYQLKPASPGSNNGSDGTDRGAFGGASVVSRYTLSGLAAIPVIYDILTSGVADASGLPVTIKARIIK